MDNPFSKIKPVEFQDAIRQQRALRPEDTYAPSNPTFYQSAKDVVPNPRCKTCSDSGWVRMNWPIGHPLFGHAIRCPRCGGTNGR